MKLSIIIPYFNEQDTLTTVLDNVLETTFPEGSCILEVICVDDASSDNSTQRLQEHVHNKGYNNVFLHSNPHNMGKGAAVRLGLRKAKGDVFFIQDADLELDTSDIPKMVMAMQELKVSFVNGSRYLPGVTRPLSSYRRYMFNRLFTFFTSVVLDVKLTDMACGYKLFTRELYEELSLKENSFGFEAELIIKALRREKTSITEIPVHYFPRNKGAGKKIRNIDGFRILKTIIWYGAFKAK